MARTPLYSKECGTCSLCASLFIDTSRNVVLRSIPHIVVVFILFYFIVQCRLHRCLYLSLIFTVNMKWIYGILLILIICCRWCILWNVLADCVEWWWNEHMTLYQCNNNNNRKKTAKKDVCNYNYDWQLELRCLLAIRVCETNKEEGWFSVNWQTFDWMLLPINFIASNTVPIDIRCILTKSILAPSDFFFKAFFLINAHDKQKQHSMFASVITIKFCSWNKYFYCWLFCDFVYDETEWYRFAIFWSVNEVINSSQLNNDKKKNKINKRNQVTITIPKTDSDNLSIYPWFYYKKKLFHVKPKTKQK